MSGEQRFSVAGRVVCVTGASAGIGRALASVLSDEGAKVVGVARRESALSEWRAEAPERRAVVVADLADPASLVGVGDEVGAPFGAPDILINGAGINTREDADSVTLDGWQTTLNLNLSAPFLLAQALAPAMKAKGWGRIVNFASMQTFRAFPASIAYGASKGGIGQLTRAMAQAWSPHGITANALAPGFVPTELTNIVFADPQRAARNAAQTCIGRNGTLDDLTGPTLFLCSPASDYVTGQILCVDGGFSAK